MNAQPLLGFVLSPGRTSLLSLIGFLIGGRVHAAELLPAVSAAMRECVARQEAAGTVTVVATRDKVLHLGAEGWADVAAKAPMRTNNVFWIASMTKPLTATAVLMMQDAGKLSVDDPVAKYVPELGDLKTADGKRGNLTLRHLLTHTSGMPDPTAQQSRSAHCLADMIPFFAGQTLQFEPGSKWDYCQSGIVTLGRIVEIVSGESFPDFLEKRLFQPLGMKDTGFYLTTEQLARLAKAYHRTNGVLEEEPFDLGGRSPTDHARCPSPSGGLFSTAPDYARFCRMILNRGTLEGRRYLKPESVKLMTSLQTGDLKTGFTDGCGWGLGWCVVREPQGITGMLSRGSFGHGGAFGTQAWIDPMKQAAYVLMFQRANFAPTNSDASEVRAAFQTAAAGALGLGGGH